jgi:hypothetical protein
LAFGFLYNPSSTPHLSVHDILKKKYSKKPYKFDEKRLRNFKTLKNNLNFQFRVFSLGFHVPAPARPTHHPSPHKNLKNIFSKIKNIEKQGDHLIPRHEGIAT